MQKEIISSGIAEYYGDFLNNILIHSILLQKVSQKLRVKIIEKIEDFFYSPLEKHFSEDTLQEFAGLADATGINKQLISRALLAPDIMQLLVSGFLRGGKKGNGNYFLGGCSAAYARGAALKPSGRALLARNLDFTGAIVWNYPTLIFNHPREKVDVLKKNEKGNWFYINKEKQPYMYISTAGNPGIGLTGMNASGITMSTFVCISDYSDRKAMPSLDFNHFIFTRIETLDALPEIVNDNKLNSAVAHTALFADKEKAICLETIPGQVFYRQMAKGFDTLVQTNHFLSPQLKQREIEFPLERESTIERFRYIRDALELHYGKINQRKMVDIISSNYNRFISKPCLTGGEFPAQPNTLMSVVIEPERGDFWLAQGKPPGVCFNNYKGFNFFNELEEHRIRKFMPDIKRSRFSVFDPLVSQSTGQQEINSLKYFLLSSEQFKLGKLNKALNLLKQAIGLHKDPGYEYLLSILYIMNHQPLKALSIIDVLKKDYKFSPIKDSILPLWEGRSYDLLGKREEALIAYKKGLSTSALLKDIRNAYMSALKKPFTYKKMPKTLYYSYLGPMKF